MRRFTFLLALVVALPAGVGAEPIKRRLLRTIQIGTLQELSVAEIVRYAKGDEADFLGHTLARSALLVLGRDRGFPDWPVPRLLDRTLNQLQRRSAAYHLPPEMPAGFGGEDLAFTVVYALMMSGEADGAIDVLEEHVVSDNRYRRGVALQALRNIGAARANAVIQRVANTSDEGNLAENLLADHHYPFLAELAARRSLIQPEGRGRQELLQAARERCTQKAALAVYFLGFLADGDDPGQAAAELSLLRDLTRAPCFYTRFFAIRSLALRSVESIDFWRTLFDAEGDAWQRAQLARIGFAHFGTAFATPALGLLGQEPVQYVQWELMHGNLEVRAGRRFRDYWDIWLPATLQFRLSFPEGRGRMAARDADELLAWLESGAHPQHAWVLNHLLYGVAKHSTDIGTRRLLRQFDSLPDRTHRWWILAPLRDAAALPLLRYWQRLEGCEHPPDDLVRLITILETLEPGSRGRDGRACCQPTRECLVSWVEALGPEGAAGEITTAEEARAWLDVREESAEVGVSFVDALARVADVSRRHGAPLERWEHLYGCWRRSR